MRGAGPLSLALALIGCGPSPAATSRSAPAPSGGPAATSQAAPAPSGGPALAAADAGCVDLDFSVFAGGPCPCGDDATCIRRCEQGSAQDCATFGACRAARPPGEAPDVAGYFRYSKKACEMGDAVGCANLGDAYAKGGGTPTDPALAEAAYAKAFAGHRALCDAGDGGACHMLSRATRDGLGVARDPAKARALEDKACALGGVMACLLLAVDARAEGHYEEGVTRDARVCELTCFCDPLLAASGRGSPAAAAAIASFRARCAGGDARACGAAKRAEKTSAGLRPRASFTGNQALTSEELDAAVEIDKPDGRLARGDTRDEVLERDQLSLIALYYDHGYLDARVDAPAFAPAPEGTFLDVRFHVTEGPRYRLGKLTIAERDARGKQAPPLGGGDLRARVALRDGDWFSRASLVRDLSALADRYRDAGYGGVEARPDAKQDAARGVVDIDVPVRRGPLVRFAHVVVTGKTRVPADALRKEIRIADGQLYSGTAIVEAKKRLQALGVFRRVDVWTKAKPDATRWTVTFEVEE